ncbi:MAG: hypothetical protein ACRC9X_02425, partial [Bacteroidales bacterium]
MTLKEAILRSLEDLNCLSNSNDVLKQIKDKGYYDFGTSATPNSSVSSDLGAFIRNGDIRVKRVKKDGATYFYYLAKNEQNIENELLSGELKILSKPST